MMAFTTKLKNPNVISVNGNEIIIKIGLISTFNTERTRLATIAVVKLLTKIISGNNTVREMKARTFTTTR